MTTSPQASAVPFVRAGWRGIRSPACSGETLERGLATGGEVVKRTPRKSVERLGGERPLALTRYALRPRPARWLRGSRALRAYRSAASLLAIGIPAAPPLFAARNGREERLGVAWVAGTRTLAEAARTGPVPPAAADLLPRLLARAHAEGLRLRDLKAENVLVGADGTLALVDFDGVGRLRRPFKAADDLSRLSASFPPGGSVSDRQRLRFLARYLGARREAGAPVGDPRAFARRVARRTEARRRRWARRAAGV